MLEGGPVKQEPIKNHFPWALSLSLYALSYCLTLLFLKAYFWDDWYIYFSKSNSEVGQLFRMHGDWPIRSFIESDVLGNRPELFRLFMIACYFFAGWFLFHILSTIKILTNEQVRLSTVLFLILPINSARVAMCNFVWSYSLLLFYLAWYLLVTKRSRVAIFLSVPLFLLSFSAVSLIIFFALPCMHLLYMKLSVPAANKRVAYLITALFAMLAPLYWIIDRRFNGPQGTYLVQYTVGKSGLMRALLLLFVCAVIVCLFLKSCDKDSDKGRRSVIISTGIVTTVVGAFPYIVGGHLVDISDWLIAFVPRFSDWDSRHQLLFGLGLSLTITGLIGSIDSTFKRHSLSVLFGLCVFWNVTNMHAYYLDALKQDQVVAVIQKSDELKTSRVIMINDLTERFNARGRGYRGYEWDGIFAKAFGDNLRSTISGSSFVHCNDSLIPDTLLTITAQNGRLESTVFRDLGIVLSVESIQPCK